MSNLFTQNILSQIENICLQLESLPLDDRIELLNQIRAKLHQISPFRDEPIDLVLWVQDDRVTPNDYNPNTVAPPEMKALKRSVQRSGYTQPIVSYLVEEQYVVIDGEHRSRVGKEVTTIRKRLHGYLPLTCIKPDRTNPNDLMEATVLHNRARGKHSVMPMAEIVQAMLRGRMNDAQIAQALGMDAEEVLRYKQSIGLPELFEKEAYSPSWE